jgi:prepilin-type N-terminal cleavage/methylation domain-containing protein/prepilin-type processing-associated H-X9-DG protein
MLMIGEPAEIDSHAAFRWRRSHFGLTLVEVLVVIAIIALLIGLLLPAVQSIRETARMAQCKNNLRMFGLAATHFETAYNAFPPSVTGVHGLTFFTVVLPYMDMASVYLDRIHPDGPLHWRLHCTTCNHNGPWVDPLSLQQSRSNSWQLRGGGVQATGLPPLPFMNCPTRGPRTSEHPTGPHQDPSWRKIRTCDYGVLSVGRGYDSLCRYPLANSVGLPPVKSGCTSAGHPNHWAQTEDSGVAVLTFAKGRRVTAAEISGNPASELNWTAWKPGAFSNMLEFHHEGPQGASGWPGLYRPYENWVSRTRAADVVDGLSMTAMLAEKHLSKWEIGKTCSSSGARSPAGAVAVGKPEVDYGNDGSALAYDYGWAGFGRWMLLDFTTGGIARGPGDDSNPGQGGATIGSWHPGECNFLMADGAVRTVGTDIADIMLRRLGDRRDQEILVLP